MYLRQTYRQFVSFRYEQESALRLIVFDMKKFRMLTPKDLNSLISQMYSAEINYIEYNRQEVGEKNIVI